MTAEYFITGYLDEPELEEDTLEFLMAEPELNENDMPPLVWETDITQRKPPASAPGFGERRAA